MKSLSAFFASSITVCTLALVTTASAAAAEQAPSSLGSPAAATEPTPPLAAPAPAARNKPANADRNAQKQSAKPKRQSRLVYAEPSLAMDADPFLALTSPAVGLVYGIPRRQ